MEQRKLKENCVGTQYFEHTKSIPLYVLAEISEQKGDTYQRIVSKEFSGRDNLLGKRRLSSRSPIKLEKEERMSREFLEKLKKIYKEEEEKTKKQEEVINRKHEIYEQKLEKYEQVKEELQRIEKELRKAEKEFEKSKMQYKDCIVSSDKLLKEILCIEGTLKELEAVVLVHRSATLNQLKQYQNRKMIVTEADNPYQYIIGAADEVFSDKTEIINLPYDMIGRELTDEEKSAVEFANMMLFYKLNGNNFEAIYSDVLVSNLLKFNEYNTLE